MQSAQHTRDMIFYRALGNKKYLSVLVTIGRSYNEAYRWSRFIMSVALDSSGANIRSANLEDAEAIAILSHQLGYSASAIAIEQRLHQILSDSSHIIYVATSLDNRAIAWIHAYAYPSLLTDFHAEIGGLVVAESDRGIGIGRKLLHQVESWAKTRGCQSLLVRSNIVRPVAHRFYQKCGYSQIKTSLVFHKDLSCSDL